MLGSLGKLLNFQHGRTKFLKRRIEVSTITDVRCMGIAVRSVETVPSLAPPVNRFLHILAFQAERAWAFALELKKENEKELKLRRRAHLVRRLRKAQLWAAELLRVATECCDARTILEADAYEALLGGMCQLEREKDWQLALAKFTRAK